MTTPHDKLFKIAFAEPAAIRALLERALPPDLVPLLDRATLRLLDPVVPADPNERRFDLLAELSVDGRTWTLAFLFEHQSHLDRAMGLRLLAGMVARWQQTLVQRHVTTSLQRIVAVVVYHGPERWTDPVDFHRRYDPPGPDHPLDVFQPDFRYLLLDLSNPANRLAKAPVMALLSAALFARWSRIKRGEGGTMLDELNACAHLVRRLLVERGQPAFAAIVEYIVHVEETATNDELRTTLRTITQGHEEAHVTIAEQIEQRGFSKGKAEGKAEGEAHGLRKALLLAGAAAFGPCPPALQRRIEDADIAAVLEALQHIPHARDWSELLSVG